MTLQFNDTLESILELNHKHELYHDFVLYLKQTYCLENVLFYQEVREYQRKPTLSRYKAIINKYIQVNSAQEINIPCEMRQELIHSETYTKTSFDQALESILELIRVNSYLPWWYQHHHRHHQHHHRNSLTPSMSVPEHRWQSLFTSRPSFTSLRDVKCMEQRQEKKVNLFQRKRQALMVRVRKTFL